MGPIISPRVLAAAIGVSESSLKRWADGGQIRVSRTAGGHRRIAISDAIRFVRATGAPLVRPELLGLSDLTPGGAMLLSTELAADRLFDCLVDGKARDARGLVMSLYLEGRSIAEIADGPIRSAMSRLGELWKHDTAGVFIEHRATDICRQAIEQLRHFVEPEAPRVIAVGGAPPGDPYVLPSLLIATALGAHGWRAENLGADTPFDALLRACEHHKPALVWISVSSVRDAAEIEQGIDTVAQYLAESKTPLAFGGQAALDFSLKRSGVHLCHSISDLCNLLAVLDAGQTSKDAQGV